MRQQHQPLVLVKVLHSVVGRASVHERDKAEAAAATTLPVLRNVDVLHGANAAKLRLQVLALSLKEGQSCVSKDMTVKFQSDVAQRFEKCTKC